MSLSPADRANRLVRFALYSYMAILGFAWLWAINASRYLRPTADDYCIGVRGDMGIVGGFVHDFQTWSGFVTPSFLTNAFLGVPLSRLPFTVALAIPFMVAAMAVAAASLTLLGQLAAGIEKRRRWIAVALLVPIIMTLWWAYLWSTYSPSGQPEPTDLTLGLTHWQNLNTGYVIPIALVVIAGVWVARRQFRNWYFAVGAGVLLGLIAGFAAPATALAVLLVAPILALGLWVLGDRYWWTKGLSVWITTLVSLVISLIAPGSEIRAAGARSGAELTLSSLPGWFATVVPDAAIAWFLMYWQWRSLLVIGTGLVIVYALRLSFDTSIKTQVGLPWLAVTLLALALSASTIVTGSVAYSAYWHQSNTSVLTFLSLVLIGVGFGGWLPVPAPRLVALSVPLLLIALALTSLANILEMTVSITDRLVAWQEGPAPIPGVFEDREVEWIRSCWQQLVTIRQ